MTDSRPPNPFSWYLGKAVPLRNRSYVVERCEVRGRELSFRLREPDTGDVRHVSAAELVTLELQGRQPSVTAV